MFAMKIRKRYDLYLIFMFMEVCGCHYSTFSICLTGLSRSGFCAVKLMWRLESSCLIKIKGKCVREQFKSCVCVCTLQVKDLSSLRFCNVVAHCFHFSFHSAHIRNSTTVFNFSDYHHC